MQPSRQQKIKGKRWNVVDTKQLEQITNDLMEVYGVHAPPVPIESMLQRPIDDTWDELDISQLSSNFINVNDYYSPRMSLARLLGRTLVNSEWGQKHGLHDLVPDDQSLRVFARMLIMPSNLIKGLSASARNPEWISVHFEVPVEDAEQRLQELG